MKLTGTEVFRLSQLIVAGIIFSLIASKLSGISIWHLAALACTMGPLGLLQARVNTPENGSIYLVTHAYVLKPFSGLAGLAFSIALIVYAWNHGFWTAVIFFFIGLLAQGPIYVAMKALPNELYLVPLGFGALVSLYYVALF